MNLIDAVRKLDRVLIGVDLEVSLFTTNMMMVGHRQRQVVVQLFGGLTHPIPVETKTLYDMTGLDGSELII